MTTKRSFTEEEQALLADYKVKASLAQEEDTAANKPAFDTYLTNERTLLQERDTHVAALSRIDREITKLTVKRAIATQPADEKLGKFLGVLREELSKHGLSPEDAFQQS